MHLHQALACVLLVLHAQLAWADAVPAAPRKIAKEPAYQQASQQFLLVLLGQKPERAIWVVRDGDDFYIDRNGNGDLTEAGEKVTPAKSRFGIYFVDFGMVRDAHGTEHGPLKIHLPTAAGDRGTVMFPIAKKFTQRAYYPVRTRPEDASILHFDGPLEAGFVIPIRPRLVPPQNSLTLKLSRSKAHRLAAWVGTLTKDQPPVFCVTFSVANEDDAKRPRLKIVCDNRDPQGPLLVETHILEEETLTSFSAPVRVPLNAGARAKLILTFPTLPNVQAHQLEVSIVD